MNKKIVYIIIAAVLIVSLAVISVFVLKNRSAATSADSGTETDSSETGEKDETTGKEKTTEALTFSFDTDDEDVTEPSGTVIASSPVDPDDPYRGIIFDRPDGTVEDPVPDSDHEHVWENTGVFLQDDPTKPWYYSFRCSVCGAEKNVYYPPEKHEFSDTVKDPTCTEDGYTSHECALCGYVYRDSYKYALGHDFVDWKVNGNVEERKCSVCGFTESRTAVPEDAQAMIVSSGEAVPGETVSLSVSLKNNPGICAFSVSIDYDSGALSLIDVIPNGSLGGQFNFGKKAAWISFGDYKNDGELMTLTFAVSASAKSDVEYPVSISYESGDISNFNEDDVDFSVVAGSVKVK